MQHVKRIAVMMVVVVVLVGILTWYSLSSKQKVFEAERANPTPILMKREVGEQMIDRDDRLDSADRGEQLIREDER